MDNLRVFLWIGLTMLLFMVYQTWQLDYAPKQQPADTSVETSEAPAQVVEPTALPALPTDQSPVETQTDSAPVPASPDVVASSGGIRVVTDVFDLTINPNGGDVVNAALTNYPLNKDQPDIPVSLLSGDPARLFLFHSGLRAADGAAEPNHLSTFVSDRNEYSLAEGQDVLEVPLRWRSGPFQVEKVFIFGRGSYAIDVEYRVRNEGKVPYRVVDYSQIRRLFRPPDRSMFDVDTYSFVGPVIYDGNKYEKLAVEDLADQPLQQTITGGWVASIQHHFLVAAVPAAETAANYSARFDGTDATIDAIGTEFVTIAPGGAGTLSSKLFIGPKLQSQLEQTADGLKLTVDYGMLTILAQPLFWLLQNIFNFVGNWGWTIVIVTMLIKLAFYKLTEASGRSMAKMRKLQPRLKTIQDRYKDDREALSRAMMELYKREKVNPVAGCLPMLIQIPFFIAFYWVLLESVEVRQAPFMLWITDLSSRDPFFILPLLMGAAMWFQQKLNPAPPDPVQAKVMQFLPVIFTGMFAFFPAGLVLYWLTNSVLSMLQQWRINKVVGAD